MSRLLLAVVVLAGAATAEPAALDLYGLVDQRLQLMQAVAAHKWAHELAIVDEQREELVIERAVADGLRYGIRPESSRRLFRAQIEAAKGIQSYWFRRWEAGAVPPVAPDLNTSVRPQLLTLGDSILSIAAAEPAHSRLAFDAAVDVPGLASHARDNLYASLRDLQRYPHRLAQILDTGQLRVGTTGDYAPFSADSGSDDVAGVGVELTNVDGVDIDLAQDLARALGVELVLIKTSWPTLLNDLRNGLFDVAMSGVSRTVERARYGFFSAPYHVGGKTVIGRCDEVDRFGSVEALDQSGVRVIVNPGGTNEAFVDTHIHQARKVLHEDNRSIFQALADGDADFMITDEVEVALQVRLNPLLCRALPDRLTYQEKGYLLGQEPELLTFVDLWLAQRMADGTVTAAFARHGVERIGPNQR